MQKISFLAMILIFINFFAFYSIPIASLLSIVYYLTSTQCYAYLNRKKIDSIQWKKEILAAVSYVWPLALLVLVAEIIYFMMVQITFDK